MEYLLIKWIHIISSTLLFGTGLGSAFYKYLADRSRQVSHIAIVNRHVVFADWLFTTPTIIIQPLTGLLLVYMAGYSLTSLWLLLSLLLYFIAGLCWLPVVVLQIRMRDLAEQAVEKNTALPEQYYRYARQWFYLGVPAFLAMIGIFFLMVFKTI